MMTSNDPFDPALKALLDADRSPPLPTGFAERVAEAALARRDPLPRLRRSPVQRWRMGRKVALALVAGGLLSSAAAATGLFGQVGIVLPPPVQQFVDDVAETVTGRPAPAPLSVHVAPPEVPVAGGRQIKGPIDSPQELETAFRDFGIEARIFSIDGPQMIGRSHLEIPVQVREERQVRLS
jgi:hypothetical protein